MSEQEAPGLEFVLRRVDAANNNVNDVRRAMSAILLDIRKVGIYEGIDAWSGS